MSTATPFLVCSSVHTCRSWFSEDPTDNAVPFRLKYPAWKRFGDHFYRLLRMTGGAKGGVELMMV